MKNKISMMIAGTAVGLLAVAGAASPASAAHCTAPAGEPSSPGFSYFGTDHVQESTHAEGQAAHSPGASSCNVTPGKNANAGQK